MRKATIKQRVQWAVSAFKNGIFQIGDEKEAAFDYNRCEVTPVQLFATLTVQDLQIVPETHIKNRLSAEIARKIVEMYPVHKEILDNVWGTATYTIRVQVIPPKEDKQYEQG